MLPVPTTDNALPLDVRQLVRARVAWGYVSWAGGSAIGYRLDLAASRLDLDYLADGRPVSESIGLVSTRCHFGGVRWWACCLSCGARIAVFYLMAGRFRCRGCHGLAYTSTREAAFTRAFRRARELRRRLGATPGIADPLPARPRGMWRRSFDRRRDAIDAADRRALALTGVWLDRMEQTIGRS